MTQKGIISQVKPASIAARHGVKPGDQLISVNGQAVQDIIDLSFALAEKKVELLLEDPQGTQRMVQIEKRYDDDLGLEFESAVFDRVRCCANRCVFCFVDQMPKGMRETLYIKDDDYRLSFLYGNFITLSNLGPNDLKRIRSMHLSPLYVSVHTTDGELRARMIGNPRAVRIMEQLHELIDSGIEIHAQIVLCPGMNDGSALDKTIEDLFALHPSVLSMAVVPVGLTRYRQDCYPMSTFTPERAAEIIAQVERWQQQCRQKCGSTFVYLADEFYLGAGAAIPDYELYDGFPQLENGIGIVRSFLDEWSKAACEAKPYEKPYSLDVVCGVSAAKVLSPLLADMKIPNLTVRLVPVENRFFGSSVTVTGLLIGQDILDALKALPGPRDGVIIPGIALRKGENVFLDDLAPMDLEHSLGVPVRSAYFAQDLRQLLSAWR